MRVLHVITSLSTGGAEVMLRNVVSRFDRRRVETLVISLTTKAPIGDELEAMGIPVVALNGRRGVVTPCQLRCLVDTASAWKPNVIHSWMYHANILSYGLAFALRRLRPVLIASVRGALDAPDQQKLRLRLLRRVDALLSRRADAIVFNSVVSARQHVAAGYDSRSIVIIPNGFDTERFAPAEGLRAQMREALDCGGKLVVGLIGRFDPLKGHRGFLTAAQQLRAWYPDCRFVLAGRGCDDSNKLLRTWIAELSLDKSVILLGERNDIPAIDCACDVVVSSSLSESFPNSIGEAMACGTPTVVTDVGDCAELVGDAGVVVTARDAAALARGVGSLLARDEGSRRELGRRARERIVERYALGSIAERFVALYERTAARRANS